MDERGEVSRCSWGVTHGKELGNKMCWHLVLTRKKIQENKKLASVVTPTATTFYFLKRAAKPSAGTFSGTLLNLTWLHRPSPETFPEPC